MSSVTPFGGLWVAAVTPFHAGSGSITPGLDFARFEAHLERLVQGGVDGIVVLGSTGEAQTLSEAERAETMGVAYRAVNRRVGLMVGVGYSDTRKAAEACRQAESMGFDGILATCPAYNKPQQAGLIAHFQVMHEACGLPLMLYNVPGRAAVNLLPETALRLAELPRVRGIKEASGDLRQVTELTRLLNLAGIGAERFAVLSGDDDLSIPCMALGAVGLVSVAGNVIPAELKRMVSDFRAGRSAEARSSYDRLLPFMKALFVESNPVPVKALLARLGRMEAQVRLPLVALAPENEARLWRAAAAVGLDVAG